MTNNIQKLYELAGVEATAIGCTNEDIQSPDYYSNDCEGDCIDCTWYDEDEVFPPFTDTKQLELIKWLVCNISHLDIYKNPKDYFLACLFKGGKHKDFSKALAGLVCELWEDLTDEQREEIRKVLE